jgi:hypothetical protein
MRLDLGDITLNVTATVKGCRPPTFVWRIGPVSDTTPADRTAGLRPEYKTRPGKADLIMDLKADQKASFALTPKDEIGNPATFDGDIVFAVDDPSIINLTDNGDGTGVAASTGALGTSLLTATATRSDGVVATGTAVVNVVAGDAETFEITFGTPEEVTPDA